MVCLGNICRSPTAQGVLDKMIMDKRLDGRLEVGSWAQEIFIYQNRLIREQSKLPFLGGMTSADSERDRLTRQIMSPLI